MLKKYVPNVASLEAGFPAALPVPELLREFARWLADQPRSSLGYFHLESAPLDAKYTGSDAATEQLRERLGIFMIFPDGSRLALWQLPDRDPAVVSLGADGELRTIASNLERLLVSMANGEPPASPDEQHAATRDGLRTWLAARGISTTTTTTTTPDFAHWFKTTQSNATLPLATRPPLTAAPLPADLLPRIDPLLGRLTDDPQLLAFFASIGIDLPALPGPNDLREIARPSEGVLFEIAWPWDLPSEWLEAQFPKPQRRELERRRARMFWAVRFFATHESRSRIGQQGANEFMPYAGELPLGVCIEDDASSIEAKLGPPIRGSMGSRLWDFPQHRRSLTVALNEGVFAKTERPLGALNSLRWGYSQSL